MAATEKKSRRGVEGFATCLANTDDLARRSTEGAIVDPSAREDTTDSVSPRPDPPSPTAAPERHAESSSSSAAVKPVQPAAVAPRPVRVVPDQPTTTAQTSPGRPRRTPRGSLPRPVPGPEARPEASGEPVVKWTIEFAPRLVHALAIWERDETKRTGQRVFRERVVDPWTSSPPR
jgi:hypothetical protein